MMSGPDPGALPMINRIGLSGNAGSAACSRRHRASAEMAIAANNLAVRIWSLLRLASARARRLPCHPAADEPPIPRLIGQPRRVNEALSGNRPGRQSLPSVASLFSVR